MTAAGIRGRSAFLAFVLAAAIVAVPHPALRFPTFHRASSYGDLPLSYEPNVGQADHSVSYLAHGKGFTVALGPGAMSVSSGRTAYTMRVVGADPHAKALARSRLPGVVNYLRGNDRTTWHTQIPTYERVRYVGVLPGIDLVYRGSRSGPEYDFDVAPGADPARIALTFDGARPTVRDGALHVGAVVQRAPHAYQLIDGRRRAVRASWRADGDRAWFELGGYDHRRPLVIDPLVVLDYATFLGGAQDDQGEAIAVDANDATYVAGTTQSAFPTTRHAFDRSGDGGKDVFVTKLNRSGSALVYSTFLGGTGDDFANSIALDGQLDVFVTGSTTSTDFPTTTGAFDTAESGPSDAFVAKLDGSGGNLLASTFLGGTNLEDGTGIAVTSNGAFVVGITGSTNFPTSVGAFDTTENGNNDVFVAKLTSDLTTRSFATYLGGSSIDSAGSIAVDSTGDPVVTGSTNDGTVDFPTTAGAFDTSQNGSFDVFVTKLNSTGSTLVWSTYLGGDASDDGQGLALDATDRPYVGGRTRSATTPFPTTPGAFQASLKGTEDGFLTRLSSDGTSLEYSTLVDGSKFSQVTGVAVDGSSDAYIVGSTGSADFPTGGDRFDPTFNGSQDAFVGEFDSTGNYEGATFLGGSGPDIGNALALDHEVVPSVYATGFMTKDFVNFHATPNAFDRTINGGRDAFVAKLSTRKMTIGDVRKLEGDTGKTPFVFTVRLNSPSVDPIRVNFATSDSTTQGSSDFVSTSGHVTFEPGQTKQTITVRVVGDHRREPKEVFLVTLTNPTGAVQIADDQARGVIVNDD